MKILFIDTVHPFLQEALEKQNHICEGVYDKNRDEIISIMPNYDGIVLRSRIKIDEDFLSQCHQLKFIARAGSGLENIDEEYAKSKNKSFVGDKDPMNSSYISQIQYCFPKSFLIHIIRDPRDVILSRMRSDWGKDTSFAVHLAEHNVQLENMLSNGMALLREKYVEVYYEQLLENPEKELQKICNKIGLLYNREMLDFQKKAEELVFSEEKAWKGNVSKPILKNNKNKWKSGLTNYQVSLVELVLKKHLA